MQDIDLVLGIDIGGTKTSFGFVDRQGLFLATTAMLTQADESAETFMSRLYPRIEEAKVTLPVVAVCAESASAPPMPITIGEPSKKPST